MAMQSVGKTDNENTVVVYDHIHVFDVQWKDLPEKERWKVAWGVWWRIAVASALLWVLVFAFMLAVAR